MEEERGRDGEDSGRNEARREPEERLESWKRESGRRDENWRKRERDEKRIGEEVIYSRERRFDYSKNS